ncbi:MAG: FtsW/RodA/SpoVE family cell cycle protein, partial [Burkholderiaceae bacterium]
MLSLPWFAGRRLSAAAEPGSGRLGQGLRAVSPSSVRDYDLTLIWAVLALMLFGMVMVYSASIALPDSARFANLRHTHYLSRHAVSLCVGLGAGLFAFAIPVQRWQQLSGPLFVAGLALLVLVLIPGIGKSVLGARRWISLGVFSLQPSELMKLFVVLYAAHYAVRKQDWMHQFMKGFAPMAVVMGMIGLLLLLEPDLGAFIVIVS